MSRPSYTIDPAVGRSWSRINFDVVVFPQPDSPMSPSVSPAWIAKSTPSTAFTNAVPRPNTPWLTGKCFVSPRTSRTGSAMGGFCFVFQEPAPGDVSVAEVELRGLVRHAASLGVGAAGMEVTTRRKTGRVGGLAGDRIQRLSTAELRHRADQGSRVRV